MRLPSKDRMTRCAAAYGLLGIPLLFVLVFSYYPIVNGFIHIFYRWDGDAIEEYIGLGNIVKMMHDQELWGTFFVITIFTAANLLKMIPALLAAVVLHHILSPRWQYLYRVLFVIPMVVPAVVGILMWKYFYEPNQGALNQLLRLAGILGQMESIAWLTEKHLVIPSLIFVGFPWVGAFGVFVYLAGLQSIPRDLYESAAMDGAGPIRTFWNIELPLILTQVRINLFVVVVATIQGWEYVYLFLGESGGPDGIATVPGLYIFRESFRQGYFGYGCAVGFLLFALTLALTVLNNRFVRVCK